MLKERGFQLFAVKIMFLRLLYLNQLGHEIVTALAISECRPILLNIHRVEEVMYVKFVVSETHLFVDVWRGSSALDHDTTALDHDTKLRASTQDTNPMIPCPWYEAI
ncbi:hypothetical protein TNCV_1541461 [Trichonephila clavipes]|nr:hypothetical protein TNCV_1541461 [Trichonephila clavipes]